MASTSSPKRPIDLVPLGPLAESWLVDQVSHLPQEVWPGFLLYLLLDFTKRVVDWDSLAVVVHSLAPLQSTGSSEMNYTRVSGQISSLHFAPDIIEAFLHVANMNMKDRFHSWIVLANVAVRRAPHGALVDSILALHSIIGDVIESCPHLSPDEILSLLNFAWTSPAMLGPDYDRAALVFINMSRVKVPFEPTGQFPADEDMWQEPALSKRFYGSDSESAPTSQWSLRTWACNRPYHKYITMLPSGTLMSCLPTPTSPCEGSSGSIPALSPDLEDLDSLVTRALETKLPKGFPYHTVYTSHVQVCPLSNTH
jgi:hypothetical protein